MAQLTNVQISEKFLDLRFSKKYDEAVELITEDCRMVPPSAWFGEINEKENIRQHLYKEGDVPDVKFSGPPEDIGSNQTVRKGVLRKMFMDWKFEQKLTFENGKIK